MVDKNLLHYVVATCILVREDKFLITKRAEWEKAFPGKWTVPGGKLEVLDYVLTEKDTSFHWYNVIENLIKKEIKEEVGLDIKNINYVVSMVYIRPDKIPCLIISLWAEPIGEKIRLCNALTEYKWTNLEEAKNYDLIEGIYEELELLNKKFLYSAYPEEGRVPLRGPKNLNDGAKTGKNKEWKKENSLQNL